MDYQQTYFWDKYSNQYISIQKCREDSDNVLFIDASQSFEKENQNLLTDEDVNKIVETYRHRETIDKFSYVASLDEIKDNDYNLNIPRYVDTFEEEEPIDLDLVQRQLSDIDKEISEVESEINDYLKELEC